MTRIHKHLFAAWMITLVFVFLAGCSTQQSSTTPQEEAVALHSDDAQVGTIGDNKTLLPNNQVITPAGEQIAIRGRANEIVLTSDGKRAAILDATGGGTVVIVDLHNRTVLQEFGTSKSGVSNSPVKSARTASGSFAGLVLSSDDSTLFASQADGKIVMAQIGNDGKYKHSEIDLPKSPVEKPGTKGNPYPGGLALSGDERLLF